MEWYGEDGGNGEVRGSNPRKRFIFLQMHVNANVRINAQKYANQRKYAQNYDWRAIISAHMRISTIDKQCHKSNLLVSLLTLATHDIDHMRA